jgi:ABC-type multidrug transport system ATPase subunit
MLSISLANLGKKFNREWIFRGLTYDIPAGTKLAVHGGNGSGKSTLLQVISGFVTPNEGAVKYTLERAVTDYDKIRHHMSFASPYLQLIEDFSAAEIIEHIALFKPFKGNASTQEILGAIGLPETGNKPIRLFSSGMKQRLKLGLAILSDTPVLLLDEPVSNLDRAAIEWYHGMIAAHTQDRTVIVCSNAIKDEYFFCTAEISVTDFKRSR